MRASHRNLTDPSRPASCALLCNALVFFFFPALVPSGVHKKTMTKIAQVSRAGRRLPTGQANGEREREACLTKWWYVCEQRDKARARGERACERDTSAYFLLWKRGALVGMRVDIKPLGRGEESRHVSTNVRPKGHTHHASLLHVMAFFAVAIASCRCGPFTRCFLHTRAPRHR